MNYTKRLRNGCYKGRKNTHDVAIVKANYTKKAGAAKASIRYIEHRPGKEGERITRALFSSDGLVGRYAAYAMIDNAAEGSIFFRFVMSPDPNKEDTKKDLSLRDITKSTMDTLEERLGKPVSWVAAVHADHAPHRHVHILAVVDGRLQAQDFQVLRKTATTASLQQRQELDLAAEQKERERSDEQWELQR
jgi:hypothetical protein